MFFEKQKNLLKSLEEEEIKREKKETKRLDALEKRIATVYNNCTKIYEICQGGWTSIDDRRI